MKTLILIMGLLLLGYATTSYSITPPEQEDRPLTKENLWLTIKELDIKYPHIAFAQALLESGDLKSRLVQLNNNLFGMRYPSKRETVAIGTKKGYANYNNWIESVQDYKLYQDFTIKRKNISNSTQYINHLDKTYAEVDDYSKRLSRVIRENRLIIK